MSEPKLIAPLLSGCAMGEPVSESRGIRCCPAMDTNTQQKYIVKILSIPASQTQLDALLLTGAYPDSDAALAYFKELADDTVREAEVLQRLARLEGFCAYEGWQVEPMEEATGYEVYLKSPYRQSLERYMSQNAMTQLSAVNLGLDLCSALSACRRCGYLYVDLKPGNVFVSPEGEYRLGDLGFVALSSLQYASLPEKYRSVYTAPEISDAYAALNMTMDTYAVGLVLYQIFNGGQLPFEGSAPTEALPAPAYADYEIAEIILKACAMDPAARWEDPAQMGQALVDYMQRNGVNDTPIIPPAAEILEETPEEEPTEEPAEETEEAEETLLTADEAEVLEVLEELTDDETAPAEEMLEELAETELSEDTSEMLAHVDELIAHEVPTADEAEDVPVIILEEEEAAPAEEPVEEAPVEEEPAEEESAEEAPVEEESVEEESVEEEPVEEEPAEEEPVEEEPAEEESTEEEIIEEELPPKKKKTGLLITITCVLLAILLGLGGWLFYTQYYLQPINGITVQATQSQLTILLDTKINNDLLTVTCTDYGNKKQATVANNTAIFTDLRPNTSYKITIEISGLHKLTGVTTTTHSTSSQSLITSFTAVTGAENGSVILDFSVEGPQVSAWRVYYSTEGEAEKSQEFTGRLVTITGLTVGKEYAFRLEPAVPMFVGGTTTIKHTASNIIYAEDLTVLGFQDGKLTATWAAPEGVTVGCWNVRCYNDSGYDVTLTVTEPTAVFEGLDAEQAYTLVVKAEGMTEGTQEFISANSLTVSNVQLNADRTKLTVTWIGDAVPAEGWLVLYTVDGGEQNVVRCDTTSATLQLIPGAKYKISIEATGYTVFGGKTTYEASVAPLFSGYWVSAEHLVFSMCRKPGWDNWDRTQVKAEDYTTAFTAGEKAAFVIRVNHEYTTSPDQIEILFVIRNAENIPVSIQTVTRTWTNMWYQGYGIQEIPVMPETPGSYTMEIYYNGGSVTTQNFTIS